jgi:hypothetical protein
MIVISNDVVVFVFVFVFVFVVVVVVKRIDKIIRIVFRSGFEQFGGIRGNLGSRSQSQSLSLIRMT